MAHHPEKGVYFVYADTDSVKYIGNIDWSNYNADRISECESSGALAVDPQGITHYMGVYETEDDPETGYCYYQFKTLGAKKYQIFFKLIFPNSVNTIISALKINVSMSLIGVIMGEFLVSKKGMAIHISTADIGPIGRVTAGVKGIKLADDDEIITGLPIKHKTDTLGIFVENGLGKKIPLNELTIQGRGGKGLFVYKPCSSTGEVVGAALLSDEDNVLLVGKPNSICIAATDVPEMSRVSMGNIMVKNSKVISIVKL